MNTLSTGWSNLTRIERGQLSQRYNELSARYNITSRMVGDVRTRLMTLSAMAGIRPPINRCDVKLESARRPEVERLGAAAVELYSLQEVAVANNRDIMLALRCEDNAIYDSLHPRGVVELANDLAQPTIPSVNPWYRSAMTI